MADNTTLNAGTGGDTYASKDVAGVKHSRVLNETLNASGTPVDVSAVNPLPATVDTGTLMQRIEMLELLISQLLHSAGGQPPDAGGRTRVTMDQASGSFISLTGGTITNIVQPITIGGALANLPALALRDGITTS